MPNLELKSCGGKISWMDGNLAKLQKSEKLNLFVHVIII
jgi:hypothetical protein